MRLRASVHRLAAVTTAALSMLFLGAPAAVAASPQSVVIEGSRGNAYFYDLDEVISVTDHLVDGRGTRAYLHWAGVKSATVWNRKGAYTRVSKDLSIAEGTTVWLTLCYVNDGVDTWCSLSHKGVA